VTDIPLTRAGELQVSQLRPLLDGRRLGLVLTSPNLRARRTAELLGWANHEVDPDLAEWDYGGYEGRTTAEISVELGRPWWIWTDPVPPGATPGETIDQIAQRADRVLAARWLGLDPQAGALLALSAGSMSGLGYEHDRPVILYWNLSADRLASFRSAG
jgi:probable phosphoglycerate mutase